MPEFKEISWNILKKLEQHLEKFCTNFVREKFGQILIKIYPRLSKLWRKFGNNLEGILQHFDKIFRKIFKIYYEKQLTLKDDVEKISLFCFCPYFEKKILKIYVLYMEHCKRVNFFGQNGHDSFLFSVIFKHRWIRKFLLGHF